MTNNGVSFGIFNHNLPLVIMEKINIFFWGGGIQKFASVFRTLYKHI